MFPEKPKNKQKNDHSSPLRAKILIGLLSLIILLGVFTAQILPRLMLPSIHLSDVESVQIEDQWMGLSQFAPIVADYTLDMTDTGLVGDASFSIANYAVTQSTTITIPAETVQAFITMLETASLEQGPYEPFWEWTDDYPYISMLFETDHGEIEIFTSSQGESHTPWGARIDDVEYVISSDIPMQALVLIEPYLQRDILDTMVNEYNP